MANFVIQPGADSGYYFVLKAPNGKVILTSEMYTGLNACETGVHSVIENSQADRNYDRLSSSNGKLYFTLKAESGEIIGTSELYESIGGRENGISSVKENAPRAVISII
jgi:uncharacterized protein YegP (UPF0339 family)